MTLKRVIPTVGVRQRSAVKTHQFNAFTYIGSPVNCVHVLCEQGADEILVVDQDASRGAPIDWPVLLAMSEAADIPMILGGGVRGLDEARHAIDIGFDRVVVGSAATADPDLLFRIADVLGVQAVIHAIDVADLRASEPRILLHGASVPSPVSFAKHATSITNNWPGEVMITSVSDDGSWRGLDYVNFARILRQLNRTGIIAGGAQSKSDVLSALKMPEVSAVAIGNVSAFAGEGRGVAVGAFSVRDQPQTL